MFPAGHSSPVYNPQQELSSRIRFRNLALCSFIFDKMFSQCVVQRRSVWERQKIKNNVGILLHAPHYTIPAHLLC